MKLTVASLALPLLASAAPAPASSAPAAASSAPANPPFTVMAARSGSPIHYQKLNAAGEKFYLGGKTSSYCPNENCPPGNQTVFAPGGKSLVRFTAATVHSTKTRGKNRTVTLTTLQDVVVPGGQQVYIDNTGALSFTQAHSAAMPPGSTVDGLSYVPGKPWNHYTFNGWGANGFMACPTDDQNRWQVFAAIKNATVPKQDVSKCLGFSAMALTYTGEAAAWQYA
ncbi:hypothetical protein N7492_001941 [Penicillium capsulatum]|uniref:IgE-binding protein n=1 Tax=Penicillium capsulatum TaxID=69766 RepID=A0A9W9IKH2_9EURO|nr:hypothetical protein N7492_001941 [Penicillium capsulatum]KAJ6123436.1 hypothetical protein N7512_005901 [Penicillium capsulatum]